MLTEEIQILIDLNHIPKQSHAEPEKPVATIAHPEEGGIRQLQRFVTTEKCPTGIDHITLPIEISLSIEFPIEAGVRLRGAATPVVDVTRRDFAG